MARGRKLIGDSRRVAITFTIEIDVINEFKEYCKTHGVSGIFFIQKKIEEFLKEKASEK